MSARGEFYLTLESIQFKFVRKFCSFLCIHVQLLSCFAICTWHLHLALVLVRALALVLVLALALAFAVSILKA